MRIEQTFGILKQRFGCLLNGMRISPSRAAKVIIACAILHNIATSRHDYLPPDEPPPGPLDDDNEVNEIADARDGKTLRQLITATHFN